MIFTFVKNIIIENLQKLMQEGKKLAIELLKPNIIINSSS